MGIVLLIIICRYRSLRIYLFFMRANIPPFSNLRIKNIFIIVKLIVFCINDYAVGTY